MKILKKSALFIALILVLVGILLLRNKIKENKTEVRIIDRLPEAELIGRMNFIELSKEIQGILFKYKLPVREFASADFILTQAKNSGVNLNSQVYFFGNPEQKELGFLLSVLDSSKIKDFVLPFKKNTIVLDSSQGGSKVFHLPKLNLNIAYDKSYLFVYSGSQFKKNWKTIKESKPGSMRSQWRRFMQSNVFKNDRLVFYTESNRVKEWGCDYAMFAHDNDSTEVKLKFYLHTTTPHQLSVSSTGYSLPKQTSDSKQIDIHINPQFFDSDIGEKVKKKVIEYAKNIGFPTIAFFDAWQGNISFREGGTVTVTEKIIESQFDQDFNVIEVVRYKTSYVPGYAVLFDLNPKGVYFQNALKAKGILREEQNKLRFLYSPLLNYSLQQQNFHLYTSSENPTTFDSRLYNEVLWQINGSKVRGGIDRIEKSSIQGTINLEAPLIIKYLQDFFKKSKKVIF